MNAAQRRALKLRTRYDRGKASVDDIAAEAAKYRFYHNIEIVPGLRTLGGPTDVYVKRVGEVMHQLPFEGKRVLDIGCRDGAMMFLAEKLGASEIVGIDNDLSPGLTDFLLPFKRSTMTVYALNLNDLSPAKMGTFDIVICAGVLYHLRYPVWGLRRIADILNPNGILLLEGGFIEAFADLPVICCPIGTDSPYEGSSVTFFNQAGLTDTLLSIGFSMIRHWETFCRTFDPDQERTFVQERFPVFFAQFCEKASLGYCRKIFTCEKQWSKGPRLTDPRTKRSAKTILHDYWDGLHNNHSRGARAYHDRHLKSDGEKNPHE